MGFVSVSSRPKSSKFIKMLRLLHFSGFTLLMGGALPASQVWASANGKKGHLFESNSTKPTLNTLVAVYKINLQQSNVGLKELRG